MLIAPVSDPSQIGAARRAVVEMSTCSGLDAADAARAALVATELASNLLRHGGGGELLLEPAPQVLTIVAIDRGAGMADVQACLRDGYSTAGTPGTGLGAIRRQADDFDIFSTPGGGTAILMRCRARRQPAPGGRFMVGAVNLAKPGEEISGDSWDVHLDGESASVIVADGLGHGPLAAQASGEAIRLFRKTPSSSPMTILEAVHAGLRPTRGAAVAVAHLDLSKHVVVFGGVGNISGTLLAAGTTSRMVSHNGTAGHVAPRLRELTYPFSGLPTVILCSDGLNTSWSLDRYPGLVARDPTLIAAVLYRDHSRGRDDATAVVVQVRPQ